MVSCDNGVSFSTDSAARVFVCRYEMASTLNEATLPQSCILSLIGCHGVCTLVNLLIDTVLCVCACYGYEAQGNSQNNFFHLLVFLSSYSSVMLFLAYCFIVITRFSLGYCGLAFYLMMRDSFFLAKSFHELKCRLRLRADSSA